MMKLERANGGGIAKAAGWVLFGNPAEDAPWFERWFASRSEANAYASKRGWEVEGEQSPSPSPLVAHAARKDCLGRPIREPETPEAPRKTALTEDELQTIANDARTTPPSNHGRHVMPLLQHITHLESRDCHRCRFWVGHNQAHAHVGECTYVRFDGAKARLANGLDSAALLTAFDWGCKAWEYASIEQVGEKAASK